MNSKQQKRTMIKAFRLFLTAVLLATMAIGVIDVTPVYAATLTVTTTVDELNTNGNCSLREAIINANNNDQSGSTDCTAGSGVDTIVVPAGTYVLSVGSSGEDIAAGGDLDITDSDALTINGDSAETTIIDANDIDRVFDVRSGAVVTFNDLTIPNGSAPTTGESDPGAYCGGGIRSVGSLGVGNTVTLNRCLVTSNQVTGSLPDGGGIYNYGIDSGSMTINFSTVSDNTSGDHAGGIYNASSNLYINNSTISGNTAGDDGGGIRTSGDLENTTINDSTIADNTAGDEGGGIRIGIHIVTIKNSILADNTAATGPDCYTNSPGDDTVSLTYSLLENTNGCTLDTDSNNQKSVDPNLAALADNGGTTQTHALQSPSNAIDNGHTSNGGTASGGCLDSSSSLVNTDQRGGARAQGANKGDNGCDIGAYEYQSTQTPTIITLRGFAAHSGANASVVLSLGLLGTIVVGLALALRRRSGQAWRARRS